MSKKKRPSVSKSLPSATAIVEAAAAMLEMPWMQAPVMAPPATADAVAADDDGCGILSNRLSPREIDAFCKAAKLQEEEAAAYERELQARYEEIDGLLGQYIRNAVEAERTLPLITEQVKADFEDFEHYCIEERLPSLPADPRAVAMFICRRAETLAAAIRMRDAVSTVHRRMKEQDPTLDLAVRAVIRQIGNDENEKQPKKDLN
jgi:hypothetical protein